VNNNPIRLDVHTTTTTAIFRPCRFPSRENERPPFCVSVSSTITQQPKNGGKTTDPDGGCGKDFSTFLLCFVFPDRDIRTETQKGEQKKTKRKNKFYTCERVRSLFRLQ
jgi:hypothetical protein